MNKEKQSIEETYQQLRTLLELSEATVKASAIIPEDQKRIYLADYQATAAESETFFKEKKNGFLKQLIKEVLTPWNEEYDEDSQRFWKLAKQAGLPFNQRDYLGEILKRGRITNFDEYTIVEDSIVIWQQEGRITGQQAAQLEKMLDAYEQKHGT
jgi:hypothetical protein